MMSRPRFGRRDERGPAHRVLATCGVLATCALAAGALVAFSALSAARGADAGAEVRADPPPAASYRALLARAELSLELSTRLRGLAPLEAGAPPRDQTVLADFLTVLARELQIPRPAAPTDVGLALLEACDRVVVRLGPEAVAAQESLPALAASCWRLADDLETVDPGLRQRAALQRYAWRFRYGKALPLENEADLARIAEQVRACSEILDAGLLPDPAAAAQELSEWVDGTLASPFWQESVRSESRRNEYLADLMTGRPTRGGVQGLLSSLGSKLEALRKARLAGAAEAASPTASPTASPVGPGERDLGELHQFVAALELVAVLQARDERVPSEPFEDTELLASVFSGYPRLRLLVLDDEAYAARRNPAYVALVDAGTNAGGVDSLHGRREPISASVIVPGGAPLPLPPAPIPAGLASPASPAGSASSADSASPASSASPAGPASPGGEDVWCLLPGYDYLLRIPVKSGHVELVLSCESGEDLVVELPPVLPRGFVLLRPPTTFLANGERVPSNLLVMAKHPWTSIELVSALNEIAPDYIWPPGNDEVDEHEDVFRFLSGFLMKSLAADVDLRTVPGRQRALVGLTGPDQPALVGGPGPDGASHADLLRELLARFTDVRLPRAAICAWLDSFAALVFDGTDVGVRNLRLDDQAEPNIRYVVREAVRPFL